MEFFYVSKSININLDNPGGKHMIPLTGITPEVLKSGSLPNNAIYISTLGCVHSLQDIIDKNKGNTQITYFNEATKKTIFNLPNCPINISNFDITKIMGLEKDYRIENTPFVPLLEKISPLLEKDTIRVVIINGIGTGIGDSVIGIRALQIFHEELKKRFDNVIIDLFQTPFNTNLGKKKLYEQEKTVNSTQILPLTMEQFLTYNCVVDFSSMVSRETFDTIPMMDFFLENLGIDPKTIDNKRNFVKINEKVKNDNEIKFIALKQTNKPSLMIHANSSVEIRSMPTPVLQNLVQKVLDETDYNVILSCDVLKSDFKKFKSSFKEYNRIYDFSGFCKDVDDFTYLISNMDSIITVDTCVYHISDSFDIPTVAIFTTIDPALRTSYYPFVSSIVLEPNNKMWGAHWSGDADEIAYCNNLWKKLSVDKVLNDLQDIKKSEKTLNCPVCDSIIPHMASDRYNGYELVTCGNCESEFSAIRNEDNYDNHYKSDYDHYINSTEKKDDVVNGYMRQIRFESVKKFLEVSKKSKLLDVGCANGFFVSYTRDLGFNSYGIDISQEAIKYAETKLQLKDKVYVGSSLNDLPKLLPKKYDIITSFEIVEHLENPNDFAKSVYDRLEDGGIWIFSTPNRNRLQFKMGVKNTGKHSGLESGDYPAEHLTRFTNKSHKILAERNGFEILHQCSSRLHRDSIIDGVGHFPGITVEDNLSGNKINVDATQVENLIYQHIEKFTDSLSGYGNFLITFCKKP